jgi:hypothetical protein
LEISWLRVEDLYVATVSVQGVNGIETFPIQTNEGQALLDGSTLMGFVEGASQGRTSSRNVTDPSDRFEGWARQAYDQPPGSGASGGKVWEHWCTTRTITDDDRTGHSVVEAYITLVNACGDTFAPVVARGRTSYGHPVQLAALVEAGFTAAASARPLLSPMRMQPPIELLLHEATPEAGVLAAEQLRWTDDLEYYMFARRIGSWNSTPI